MGKRKSAHPTSTPDVTITQVFAEFLSDQRERLSPKTYQRYDSIIGLFADYLEGYWPGHDQDEYRRITANGGTFCDTFGPEEILGGYSEFLGYYLPNKVICGKDTSKAAGTVTRKLAKWMAEKGYATETRIAEERATEAGKNLPAAQDVLRLLDEYVDWNVPEDYSDEIQDHFWIRKFEPGKLWLEALTMPDGVIGPIPVPEEVTQTCKLMWDISGIVVKTRRGWRLMEVWNVTP